MQDELKKTNSPFAHMMRRAMYGGEGGGERNNIPPLFQTIAQHIRQDRQNDLVSETSQQIKQQMDAGVPFEKALVNTFTQNPALLHSLPPDFFQNSMALVNALHPGKNGGYNLGPGQAHYDENNNKVAENNSPRPASENGVIQQAIFAANGDLDKARAIVAKQFETPNAVPHNAAIEAAIFAANGDKGLAASLLRGQMEKRGDEPLSAIGKYQQERDDAYARLRQAQASNDQAAIAQEQQKINEYTEAIRRAGQPPGGVMGQIIGPTINGNKPDAFATPQAQPAPAPQGGSVTPPAQQPAPLTPPPGTNQAPAPGTPAPAGASMDPAARAQFAQTLLGTAKQVMATQKPATFVDPNGNTQTMTPDMANTFLGQLAKGQQQPTPAPDQSAAPADTAAAPATPAAPADGAGLSNPYPNTPVYDPNNPTGN